MFIVLRKAQEFCDKFTLMLRLKSKFQVLKKETSRCVSQVSHDLPHYLPLDFTSQVKSDYTRTVNHIRPLVHLRGACALYSVV